LHLIVVLILCQLLLVLGVIHSAQQVLTHLLYLLVLRWLLVRLLIGLQLDIGVAGLRGQVIVLARLEGQRRHVPVFLLEGMARLVFFVGVSLREGHSFLHALLLPSLYLALNQIMLVRSCLNLGFFLFLIHLLQVIDVVDFLSLIIRRRDQKNFLFEIIWSDRLPWRCDLSRNQRLC
jgi:hypothetical protein